MRTIAVAIGDNCIDHYLPPIGRDFNGGNAVNVAVYLQRAGCPTAYIGAIGADSQGKQLLQDLGREGVDTTHVKVHPGYPTACTHIRLSNVNERQFVYEDLGPFDVFALDAADLTFIHGHRLVHNTWQGGTEKYLPRFRQASGLLISQDYGERCSPDFIDRTIAYVDLAFFSLPEESSLKMDLFARQMKARGPRLVVTTQGKLGSVSFDGNFHFQPACHVNVVDTLGAGDAFIGTFLGSWLGNKKVSDCMQDAAEVASQACSHYGAW